MHWAAVRQGGHMAPKGDTPAIGISHPLLFDVLTGSSISCEAVCFFFLPKPGLGVAWGQVEGGRLKAMGHRDSLANYDIGGLSEVGGSLWG